MSVFWRLLFGFLTITILINIIGMLILGLSFDIIMNNAQETFQTRIELTAEYMEKELYNTQQMLVALSNDPDMLTYILFKDEDVSERIFLEKSIATKMNIIYYSSDFIDDVYMIIPDNNRKLSIMQGNTSIGKKDIRLLEHMKESKTRLNRYMEDGLLTYCLAYPNIYKEGYNVEFLLVVDVIQSKLIDVLKALQTDDKLSVFLVDNMNQQLVSTGTLAYLDRSIYQMITKQESLPASNVFKINGQEYIINIHTSLDSVFTLVLYVDKDVVLNPVYAFRKIYWLFLGGTFFLVIIFAFLIYRSVHRPLQRLVIYMNKIEKGNFQIYIDNSSRDEFGYVFRQFNRMVAQLHNLIDEVLEKKIQLQQAQLKQLQSKINPHFLFNCFYIAYRMARSGDTENIADLCIYLGEYFHFITKTREIISLKDEFNFTKTYLEIQKIRFPTKLSFYIHLDEKIEEVKVPGLIIQPLVENSIIHGIELMEDNGLVEVKAVYREDLDAVVVQVADNGVGMNDSKKEQMRSLLESNTSDTFCGMWSVHWRLREIYKNASGLVIEDNEPNGLKVSFSIPMKDVMEDHVAGIEEGGKQSNVQIADCG